MERRGAKFRAGAVKLLLLAAGVAGCTTTPSDTAVVSLCAMHAGNPGAMSVIPSHATLVGTVRAFEQGSFGSLLLGFAGASLRSFLSGVFCLSHEHDP